MALRTSSRFTVAVLVGIALTSLAAVPSAAQGSAPGWPAEHEAALRRAQVWLPPERPIPFIRLGDNPDRRFRTDEIVSCRFAPEPISGNTPKFHCTLPDGDRVRVKYGAANPEVFAEVIASRLLAALGFPTDRMYVVAAVRCAGCPAEPFEALQCLGRQSATVEGCFGDIDESRVETFRDAVIEKPLEGRRIEAEKRRGWGWNELGKIEATAGGASRAQVDAFRLLAVFLAHWDNKPENQRLLCLDDSDDCTRPLAMIQDLGATFGPEKIDVKRWSAAPVWTDAKRCAVSMRGLPYGGSSFPDARISEAGRTFLAGQLEQLTETQVRDLFSGARIHLYTAGDAASRDVQQWVAAFMNKRAAIVERSPCPE